MQPTIPNSVSKLKGPRACSTCARAKSRCIPGPDANRCERCHRLNKTCPSQTPAPPRKRKEPKVTRVAELERRLQDLTSRMENVTHQQQAQSQQAQVPSPPESLESGPGLHPGATVDKRSGQKWTGLTGLNNTHPFRHLFLDVELSDLGDIDQVRKGRELPADVRRQPDDWQCLQGIIPESTPSQPPLQEPSTQQPPLVPPVHMHLWPMGEDADALLAEYRRCREHRFPFAIVPRHMKSDQVREQRPFLWKAIMMEACHQDGLRQISLGEQLLRDITEAAVMRPQKSIDLLQGLQALISWFHYNLNSFQMTNLLYLARSITVALGINEAQTTSRQTEHIITSESLEKMRAFAGTYYLVTVIFTTNKKPDALMNTSYLDSCLATLEAQMEYPTDSLLVWLVRAQQLAQSISLTISLKQSADQLPMTLIIKSFQQQLEVFKSSVPADLKDNPTLKGHSHVAEILLYEIGLQENSGLAVTDRLKFLWACVTSTKALFSERMSMGPCPDEEGPGMTKFMCMSSFDYIYAFLTVVKLITLQIPGWDLGVVRQELQFDDLLDMQIENMQALADRRMSSQRRAGGTAEGGDDISATQDPFRMLALKLKMLKDGLCAVLNVAFNESLAKAATTGAMTVTDATQGIVEELEGSLWQSLMMGATLDWEVFDPPSLQGFGFPMGIESNLHS